jgi:hypothetical protein
MVDVTRWPDSQDEIDESADTEPYLSRLLPEVDDEGGDFGDGASDEELIGGIGGGEEEDLAGARECADSHRQRASLTPATD